MKYHTLLVLFRARVPTKDPIKTWKRTGFTGYLILQKKKMGAKRKMKIKPTILSRKSNPQKFANLEPNLPSVQPDSIKEKAWVDKRKGEGGMPS